jgi:DNA (cytosine-5)-methyltransferase 1
VSGRAEEALARRADPLGHIDVLTAGYPCQPFSTAARGRNNARDLWPEALRIIRQLRPRWVVLENVPGYRLEHVERSCRDLEDSNYAVWPLDVAVEVRNHVRRRIWVVAHADSEGEPRCSVDAQVARVCEAARRWRDQSEPMGMDDGVRPRSHRMKALGNGIVVPIAELIGLAFSGDSGNGR